MRIPWYNVAHETSDVISASITIILLIILPIIIRCFKKSRSNFKLIISVVLIPSSPSALERHTSSRYPQSQRDNLKTLHLCFSVCLGMLRNWHKGWRGRKESNLHIATGKMYIFGRWRLYFVCLLYYLHISHDDRPYSCSTAFELSLSTSKFIRCHSSKREIPKLCPRVAAVGLWG